MHRACVYVSTPRASDEAPAHASMIIIFGTNKRYEARELRANSFDAQVPHACTRAAKIARSCSTNITGPPTQPPHGARDNAPATRETFCTYNINHAMCAQMRMQNTQQQWSAGMCERESRNSQNTRIGTRACNSPFACECVLGFPRARYTRALLKTPGERQTPDFGK